MVIKHVLYNWDTPPGIGFHIKNNTIESIRVKTFFEKPCNLGIHPRLMTLKPPVVTCSYVCHHVYLNIYADINTYYAWYAGCHVLCLDATSTTLQTHVHVLAQTVQKHHWGSRYAYIFDYIWQTSWGHLPIEIAPSDKNIRHIQFERLRRWA